MVAFSDYFNKSVQSIKCAVAHIPLLHIHREQWISKIIVVNWSLQSRWVLGLMRLQRWCGHSLSITLQLTSSILLGRWLDASPRRRGCGHRITIDIFILGGSVASTGISNTSNPNFPFGPGVSSPPCTKVFFKYLGIYFRWNKGRTLSQRH